MRKKWIFFIASLKNDNKIIPYLEFFSSASSFRECRMSEEALYRLNAAQYLFYLKRLSVSILSTLTEIASTPIHFNMFAISGRIFTTWTISHYNRIPNILFIYLANALTFISNNSHFQVLILFIDVFSFASN